MAIPKLTEEKINEALKYIDEHGVPWHNESTVYVLVADGKKYPPKYLIAVSQIKEQSSIMTCLVAGGIKYVRKEKS